MRHVDFGAMFDGLSQDARQWFETWRQTAETKKRKLQEALDAGREPKLDQRVWAELKGWLLANIFHGKCAYCEGMITRDPGHGEHYRPKGKVRDRHRKPIMSAAGAEHPGYYWLAYDDQNLIPACFYCNVAKRDQFPVENEHVFDPAPGPQQLDLLEAPMLLHPYDKAPGRDPSEHLVFGAAGTVAAKDESKLGRDTIETLNLNSEELRRLRQEKVEDAESAGALAAQKSWETGIGMREFWSKWAGPRAEFSAAVSQRLGPRVLPRIAAEIEAGRAGGHEGPPQGPY